MMTDTTVMVAQRSVMVDVDGTPAKVRRRRTTAHAGAAIVAQHPDLWAPLVIDFPAEPDTGSSEASTTEPSAKDVRAWARGQGIEVPARGTLPADVVTAYRAVTRGR